MALFHDLRYGFRSFGRHRLANATIVVSLALGLTVATSVFDLLYQTLLRPLPFPRPERLVRVTGIDPEHGTAEAGISPLAFAALMEAKLDGLDALAAVVADADLAFDVRAGGPARRIRGAVVSPGLFDLLGAEPSRGRVFRPEGGPSEGDAVVVSEKLWRSVLAADPRAVGSTLRLNGRPVPVLGVLPAGLGYPEGVELWLTGPERAGALRDLPLLIQADYDVVGRLAEGASLAAAAAELRTAYEAVRGDYPRSALMAPTVRVETLQRSLTAGARRPLLLLQTSVGAILLICCANISGLLLVRTNLRRRELAIRSSLGAGPADLLRQLTAEILLLFLAGGLLGALAGSWVDDLLLAAAPAQWSRYAGDPSLPTTVIAALALTSTCAVIAGLVPVASALRPDFVQVIGHGPSAERPSRLSLGRLVIVGEIGLAVSLLVAAGLVTRSLDALQGRDLGFSTENLLTARVTLLQSRGLDRDQRARWINALRENLEHQPGVQAVGATQLFFVTDGVYRNTITGLDGPAGRRVLRHPAGAGFVSPGYFEALGVPILAGRALGAGSGSRGVAEAVVSRSLARELWPRGHPVGQRLELEGRWWEVVGVAGDMTSPERGDLAAPRLFLPRSQAMLDTGAVTYLVRGASPGSVTARSLDSAIRRFDPGQAPGRIERLDAIADRALAPQRFASMLLGVLSLLASLLAGVGIHGVVSQWVNERRRELGARRAVGASTGHILWEVLGASGRLGLAGAALGALGATAGARGLESLLFGVSSWDGPSWGIGLLLGLVMPIVASLAPAGRACGVDPAVVLREP